MTTTNSRKPLIGLFPGSFNPIHIGHLALANYLLVYTAIDEVWFVISPQNPLKDSNALLAEEHRLAMLYIALKGLTLPFKACDIEFGLPKPSYTYNTLGALAEKYPGYEFCLLMGTDNIASINKWRNYEEILSNYKILVYPRPGYTNQDTIYQHDNIKFVNAPLLDISATFVRDAIRNGKNIETFLPPGVYQYIKNKNLY